MLALFTLLCLGMPIAFGLGVISTIGIILLLKPEILFLIAQTAYSTPNSFVLVAVPLFILMAEVLYGSDLSYDLFDSASHWLGRMPGGLASSSVLACALFSALTGSSSANVAAMGTVCTPEMLKRGYNKGLATGSVCAAGALGILIPPSVLLIIYGSITDTSVADLFIAGIIPGIMLAGLHITHITIHSWLMPNIAPRTPSVPWRVRWRSTLKVWWVILLIVLMMGGIYSGACTPTEAAAIGAFAAIVLGITLSKSLTWEKFRSAVRRSVTVTSMVLFIMVGAMIFGYFLTHLRIPQKLVDVILGLSISPWIVMICINILYIVLGCLMDVASIVLITVPILDPVVRAIGFDPIWFGIVIVMNMEIANISPPLGINLFVMKGIVPPDISYMDIVKGILPFIGAQVTALILVMVFPQLTLWLPSTMH
jgi:C4-dicarboxylate transporter DctM subunit